MWGVLAASLFFLPFNRLIAWVILAASAGMGLYHGVLTPLSLSYLLAIVALAGLRHHFRAQRNLAIALEGLVVAGCVALFLHLVPGIHNQLMIDGERAGPLSAPFTMYYNFDKAMVPFLLFACLPTLFSAEPGGNAGKAGWIALLLAVPALLLQLYDLLGQVQQKAFDVLQQDDLPLDSLLAAISRFSLQTSARNQFFGTVIERDHQQVQQHLAILLNDGTTRLTAAITQQSADRLQLVPGKEVLALIKAPWVRLSIETGEHTGADNALAGVVAGIQPGAEHSEVLVTLAGGETLCATLTTAELQRLQLSVGTAVHALFNADHVIVATLC